MGIDIAFLVILALAAMKGWPVIAFAAVFLVAVFIVKAVGGIVEKTVQLAMLGWVNRIGGFLVYAVLYTLLFSVVLFFLTQMNLVTEAVKGKSVTSPILNPGGHGH